MNNVRTKRCIGCMAGMLIALTATVGFSAEPLTYYGFDEASHSAAAHEGMQEIFAGRLFHNTSKCCAMPAW